MLTSEYAELNPTSITEGVDNAIRSCWRSMHEYRGRNRVKTNAARWWDNQMAEKYRHALMILIQIRRGEWQS